MGASLRSSFNTSEWIYSSGTQNTSHPVAHKFNMVKSAKHTEAWPNAYTSSYTLCVNKHRADLSIPHRANSANLHSALGALRPAPLLIYTLRDHHHLYTAPNRCCTWTNASHLGTVSVSPSRTTTTKHIYNIIRTNTQRNTHENTTKHGYTHTHIRTQACARTHTRAHKHRSLDDGAQSRSCCSPAAMILNSKLCNVCAWALPVNNHHAHSPMFNTFAHMALAFLF